MSSRQKVFPWVWVLLLAWGAMLAFWWLAPDDAATPVQQRDEQPLPAAQPVEAHRPAPVGVSGSGAQSARWQASDLAAQYRQFDAAVVERHKGRRMQIAGTVTDRLEGVSGTQLLHLDAGQGLPPLRGVLADGVEAAAATIGAAVVLDCLHAGVIMGEPLLNDCRLVVSRP